MLRISVFLIVLVFNYRATSGSAVITSSSERDFRFYKRWQQSSQLFSRRNAFGVGVGSGSGMQFGASSNHNASQQRLTTEDGYFYAPNGTRVRVRGQKRFFVAPNGTKMDLQKWSFRERRSYYYHAYKILLVKELKRRSPNVKRIRFLKRRLGRLKYNESEYLKRHPRRSYENSSGSTRCGDVGNETSFGTTNPNPQRIVATSLWTTSWLPGTSGRAVSTHSVAHMNTTVARVKSLRKGNRTSKGKVTRRRTASKGAVAAAMTLSNTTTEKKRRRGRPTTKNMKQEANASRAVRRKRTTRNGSRSGVKGGRKGRTVSGTIHFAGTEIRYNE